jgi:hypothetical protein
MSPNWQEIHEELERVLDKFPKYHKKILLRYFNAKLGREEIFKPRTGNEILYEISNVNFATPKNLSQKVLCPCMVTNS